LALLQVPEALSYGQGRPRALKYAGVSLSAMLMEAVEGISSAVVVSEAGIPVVATDNWLGNTNCILLSPDRLAALTSENVAPDKLTPTGVFTFTARERARCSIAARSDALVCSR
jgi:hypothetical protein